MAKKSKQPKFFILLASGDDVIELETRAEVGRYFRDCPEDAASARVILGHEFSVLERRSYTLVEGDLDVEGDSE